MSDIRAEVQADQVRLAAIRRLDPVERLRLAFELSEALRELALTRLRAEHPGCPERVLVERWMSPCPRPGL